MEAVLIQIGASIEDLSLLLNASGDIRYRDFLAMVFNEGRKEDEKVEHKEEQEDEKVEHKEEQEGKKELTGEEEQEKEKNDMMEEKVDTEEEGEKDEKEK